MLRKDFIVDVYQVYETAAAGADALLLICAALSVRDLTDLYGEAQALDLDVLVEVHDERELELALEAIDADVIGINNRDLTDFSVDLDRTYELAVRGPRGQDGGVRVGHPQPGSARRPRARRRGRRPRGRGAHARDRHGGRRLARALTSVQRDLGSALALASEAWPPSGSSICGITSLHDAELCVDAGAGRSGSILSPESARACSLEEAGRITRAMRRKVELTGVFVNERLARVVEIADVLGLDDGAAPRRRGPGVLRRGREADGREGHQGGPRRAISVT